MTSNLVLGSTGIISQVLLLFAGCALVREDATGADFRHRFAQPPQRAGACFARNAEAHSSALAAEVRPPDARGHVQVMVRVKNGIPYATVDLQPAGAGADGTIQLMVVSAGGARELVRSLVEGC